MSHPKSVYELLELLSSVAVDCRMLRCPKHLRKRPPPFVGANSTDRPRPGRRCDS